jgi:hypothetical protein
MSAAAPAAKAKKPAKKPDHPPYNQMVVAAITKLKDRSGSSRQAILKFIRENYHVNDKANKQVTLCLKRLVDKNVLIQTRGQGGSGSFKLNKDKGEPKKPRGAAKKPAAKPAAKKTETKPRKPRAGKDQADGKARKPKAKPSKPKTEKAKKPAKPAAKAKSPAKVKKSPAKPKPAARKPASKKPTPKKPAAKKPAAKGGKKAKA